MIFQNLQNVYIHERYSNFLKVISRLYTYNIKVNKLLDEFREILG